MDIKDTIRQIFRQTLPGEDAQLLMSPSNRFPGHLSSDSSHARNCSVMLLLYCRQGEWMIVLMERPSYSGAHGGQVSLPGGKWEPGDKDAWDAAVRETVEETGVKEHIFPMGELTPLFIPHSNSLVYPMVGLVDDIGEFTPDDFEVAELIEAPIFDFFQPQYLASFSFQAYGETIIAPCYQIQGHCIWGATAMILSEFLSMIKPHSGLFISPQSCSAQIAPEYL